MGTWRKASGISYIFVTSATWGKVLFYFFHKFQITQTEWQSGESGKIIVIFICCISFILLHKFVSSIYTVCTLCEAYCFLHIIAYSLFCLHEDSSVWVNRHDCDMITAQM
jgi:hypothetical protein